jgi:hypothetical protein
MKHAMVKGGSVGLGLGPEGWSLRSRSQVDFVHRSQADCVSRCRSNHKLSPDESRSSIRKRSAVILRLLGLCHCDCEKPHPEQGAGPSYVLALP